MNRRIEDSVQCKLLCVLINIWNVVTNDTFVRKHF